MVLLQDLERQWLALGRIERDLTEIVDATGGRIKALRAEGRHEEANALADMRAEAQAELKRILADIHKLEPKYFAALRRHQRL